MANQAVNFQTQPEAKMFATYVPGSDVWGDISGSEGWFDSRSGKGANISQRRLLIHDTDLRRTQDEVTSEAAKQVRGTSIAPEMASQWPLDTVLNWMAVNNFSLQWQETFKALRLQGGAFLELGSRNTSRENLNMMHKHVYPRLEQAYLPSDSSWDRQKELDEGQRLRRLIKQIVDGMPPGQAPSIAAPSSRPTDKPLSSNANIATNHIKFAPQSHTTAESHTFYMARYGFGMSTDPRTVLKGRDPDTTYCPKHDYPPYPRHAPKSSIDSNSQKSSIPSPRGSAFQKVYVLVTVDSWNYRMIDITKTETATDFATPSA